MGSGLVTPTLSLARPCLVIAFSKLTGVRISVARITLFPKRREQGLKAIGFDFVQGREQDAYSPRWKPLFLKPHKVRLREIDEASPSVLSKRHLHSSNFNEYFCIGLERSFGRVAAVRHAQRMS